MALVRLTADRVSGGEYHLALWKADAEWPDQGPLRLKPAQAETLRGYYLDAVLSESQASQRLDLLRELGETLFGLLPPAVRSSLSRLSNPLIIRSDDSSVPWELVHDGQDFLGLGCTVSRTLSGLQLPGALDLAPEAPAALLIANPTGDLEQADDEARTLGQSLVAMGVAVRLLRGEQANLFEVLRHLRSGRYSLVHYTGHAEYGEPEGEGSLLLADGRLAASMIMGNLAGSPLVFVNGCESARQKRGIPSAFRDDTEAPSLPWVFLSRGARAYVGTSWPIPDGSAGTFPRLFYQALLSEGRPLGEAMARARAGCRSATPGDVSWSAYVAYGHPLSRVSVAVSPQAGPEAQPSLPEAGAASTVAPAPGGPEPPAAALFDEGEGIDAGRLDMGAALALYYAWREQHRRGHPGLETAHLLIGLTKVPGGHTQRTLYRQSADPKRVRENLRRHMEEGGGRRAGSEEPGVLAATHRFGHILELAQAAAQAEGSAKVQERHLLAGFVQDGGGTTARVLEEDLGIDLSQLASPAPHPLFSAGSLDTAWLDPGAREVLESAQSLASQLGLRGVSSSLLLRAMLEREGSLLRQGLQAQGKDADEICAVIRRLTGSVPRERRAGGEATQ